MNERRKIDLIVSGDDDGVAYVSLPGYPGLSSGAVKKSVRLRDLIDSYEGPDLIFDFAEKNLLVGVEILI